MGFAALDGLLAGAIVTLALLARSRRDGAGFMAALVVGLIGGLVGGLLGFAVVSNSTTSGPLQVTAIVGGAVGAAVALLVLRAWIANDRDAVVAARASAAASAKRAAKESQRARRRASREPSTLAELAVFALLVLRGRGRRPT